jgi:hypothetical protein
VDTTTGPAPSPSDPATLLRLTGRLAGAARAPSSQRTTKKHVRPVGAVVDENRVGEPTHH